MSPGKRRRRHRAPTPLNEEQPKDGPSTTEADGLERSMRRVTFADENPDTDQSVASPPDMFDGLELQSPMPIDGDEPVDAKAAPITWSRDLREQGPHTSEFRLDAPLQKCLDVVAHRTMGPVVLERERCLTRRIIVHGDTGTDRLAAAAGQRRSRSHKMLVPWPSVDLHRYMDRMSADTLHPIGIGVLENPCTTHVALEEPGAEWETRELSGAADDPEDSDVDVSDPLVNGGIGLVIKRHPGSGPSPTACSTEHVEFLTKSHLLHPELRGPRYSRVPLPDEFRDALQAPALSRHFGPLVDMTRVQVLNQILRQQSLRAMPLSRFVSCTVAEEAVAGVARTWHAVNEYLRISQRRGREPVCAGMPGTQWIAVLNAALAAGLPPEVVARVYHRLEKLCDVFAGTKASAPSLALATSFHALDLRRLRPHDAE
ncbi:hypothetical protein H4R19_000191 [Coemansia spiralis]|nr:hypothetical protein H4R19_000191 [Coemansia spiralis]